MLKRILLVKALFFCALGLGAQVKNNIGLGIELGVLDLSESGRIGLFFNLEPKLKSSKNTIIGLRIGATINSHAIKNNDSTQFYIDDQSDNGFICIVPTFDYYWNESKFRPNLGLGVGCFVLSGYVDASRVVIVDSTKDVFEVNLGYKIGLLLRGGIALGKSTRVSLEYNFIPKADIKVLDDQKIGTVENSYLGISIGYTIGNMN